LAKPARVIAGVEELRSLIGQEVGVSDWFVVSQSLIDAFADVTQDRQWIHCDPERARTESPAGTTIAHGFLTMALLSHLKQQAVHIQGDCRMSINYGFNRVRFPAPVPAGARIRLRSTLQAMHDVPGGIQVTWGVTIEIEGQSKPALVAEWLGRLYR
jgi:acyl dehydratase